MAYPKQKTEYFLNRIRKYYQEHGSLPGSKAFNAKFHTRMNKEFGTWEKAVQAATGQLTHHGRRTDEDFFSGIRKFAEDKKRIPASLEIDRFKQILKRLGTYNEVILQALGINLDYSILKAISDLMRAADCASLFEVQSELKSHGIVLLTDQLRGLMLRMTKRNLIEVMRGDRVRLFMLTAEGKKYLSTLNNGGKNGNRT